MFSAALPQAQVPPYQLRLPACLAFSSVFWEERSSRASSCSEKPKPQVTEGTIQHASRCLDSTLNFRGEQREISLSAQLLSSRGAPAQQTCWEQLAWPLAIYYCDIILYLIAPSSNSNSHSLPLGAFKYFCGVLLFIGVFVSSLLHYLFITWDCAWYRRSW